MGICRDALGRLSYTAVNSRKGVFSVTKGRNEIVKHEPWCRTTPWWEPEGTDFWFDPPEFASFIQTVSWLKEHLEELI